MSLRSALGLRLAFSVLLVCTVKGIDFNHALQNENRQCLVPKITANVNTTWVTTPRRWFYPVTSVLNLYIHGLEASTKSNAADLSEDELYYNACITYDLGLGSDRGSVQGTVTGFGGIRTKMIVKTNDGFGIINWSYPPRVANGGTSYITLTDNQTFIFMVTCRHNRMSWAVLTTYEPISEETNAIVEEHALSLGFKREYFTGLRYDTCPAYSR